MPTIVSQPSYDAHGKLTTQWFRVLTYEEAIVACKANGGKAVVLWQPIDPPAVPPNNPVASLMATFEATLPEDKKPCTSCGDRKRLGWLSKAKNFAGAVARFAASPGFVTKEQYQERLFICEACPHVDKRHNECGLCSCKLVAKAALKTESCPDDPSRWPKLEVIH